MHKDIQNCYSVKALIPYCVEGSQPFLKVKVFSTIFNGALTIKLSWLINYVYNDEYVLQTKPGTKYTETSLAMFSSKY